MNDKLIKIFEENSTAVDKELLMNNSSFKDSGIDSLELMNILMEVEQSFSLTIEDSEYEEINNLSDLIKLIESK